MSDIENAAQATSNEELERYIMDPSQPKNEHEWWACREIERLRKVVKEAHDLLEEYEDEAAFDALGREIKDTPHD